MSVKEINKVLKSALNKEAKKDALIQIGLSESDVETLFGLYEAENDIRYTVGVEIECFGADQDKFFGLCDDYGVEIEEESYNHTTKRHFKTVGDSSIQGANAIEVVSPVLRNSAGIDNLEKVCTALNEAGAKVNKSCGLHVHFGLQNISFNTYKNVFINYIYLEEAINKMVSQSRRHGNQYCRSFSENNIRVEALKNCTSFEDINNVCHCSRYFKVNPLSYSRHSTIEFRQHQGTVSFEKIHAWVTFLTFLVKFSEKNVLTGYVNDINDIPAKIMTKQEKKNYLKRAYELNTIKICA